MPNNIVSLAFEITANPEQAAAALKALEAQSIASVEHIKGQFAEIAKSQEAAVKPFNTLIFKSKEDTEKLIETLRAAGVQIKSLERETETAAPKLAELMETATLKGTSKADFIQGYEEALRKAQALSQQAANNLEIDKLINTALAEQKVILQGIEDKNAVVLKLEQARIKAQETSAANIAKLAELDQAAKAKAIQQLEEGRIKNEQSSRAALNQYEVNKTINAALEQQAAILAGIQEKNKVVLGLEEARAKAEQTSATNLAKFDLAQAAKIGSVEQKLRVQEFRSELKALEARMGGLGITTSNTVSRMARFTGAMRGLTFPINRVAGRIVEITNSFLRLSPLVGLQIPNATAKAATTTESLSAAFQNAKKQIELYAAGLVSAEDVEKSMVVANEALAASNTTVLASLGPIGIAVAAVGAAYAALGVITAHVASKYIVQINDMSRATGLSLSTMSGLYYAARTAGIPFKDLQTEIAYFTRQLGEGGQETKRFRDTLSALGVTSTDAQTAFSQAVDKLNHYKDSAQASALAANLFSRSTSGQVVVMEKLIHTLGAFGGVQGAVTAARKAGFEVTRQQVIQAQMEQIEIHQLGLEFHAMAIVLGEEFLPKVIHWLALIESSGPILSTFVDALKVLYDPLAVLARLFLTLTDSAAAAATAMIAAGQAATGHFAGAASTAEKSWALAKDAARDFAAAGQHTIDIFKDVARVGKDIDSNPFSQMQAGAKAAEEQARKLAEVMAGLESGANAPKLPGTEHIKVFNDRMADQLARIKQVSAEMAENELPAREKIVHSYDMQRLALDKLLKSYAAQLVAHKLTNAQAVQIQDEYNQAVTLLRAQLSDALKKFDDEDANRWFAAYHKKQAAMEKYWTSQNAHAHELLDELGKIQDKFLGTKPADFSKPFKDMFSDMKGHAKEIEQLQKILGGNKKFTAFPFEQAHIFEGINLSALGQSLAQFNQHLQQAGQIAGITVQPFTRLRFELAQLKQAFDLSGLSLTKVSEAMGQNIAQAIVYGDNVGKAMEKAMKATIASIAGQALVQAIYQTAWGFADLAIGDFADASLHFESAAIFGAVGAAAAAIGAAIPGGGAGASTRGAGSGAGSSRISSGASATGAGATLGNALAPGARGPQVPQGNLTVAIMGNEEAGTWLATTLNKAVTQQGQTLIASHTQRNAPVGQ